MSQIVITQILMKRGNTAAASTYVGPLGELLVDTGLDTIRVQDGSTPGGFLVATAAQLANVSSPNSYLPTYSGNIGNTTVTGNVTTGNVIAANYLFANGVNILSTVTGGGGTYGNADVAAYLPIYSGNIAASNVFSNNYRFANGVNILSTIAASSTYSNSNVASYLLSNTDATISNLNANAATQALAIQGINANIGAYQTYANNLIISTAYTDANVAAYLPTYTGSLGGTLTTASQPNITSLGTLTNLTVAGNLTIQGNTFLSNTSDLTIEDSIINLHTFANLAPLASNDGRDIGIKFHYYDTEDSHAFVGRANDTGYLTWYSRGTETGNIFAGSAYGIFKTGEIILANATASTSTTSGALQVAGGAGIAGNVIVGGSAIVAGVDLVANVAGLSTNITAANTGMKGYVDDRITTVTTAWQANAQSQETEIISLDLRIISANSYHSANAAVQAAGIQNLNANLGAYQTFANSSIQTISANAGSFQTYTNNQFASTSYTNANVAAYLTTATGNVSAGNIVITGFTPATSNVSGAFVVAGGAGIGGNLYVYGDIYSGGSRTLNAADLTTTTYTASYITMNPAAVPVPVVGTATTYGTYNFGTLANIQTYGDYNETALTGFYSVNDQTGAPGHVEYVGFTDVTEFNRLVMNVNYTASSGHTQDIDLYNYSNDTWDTFGTYSGSGSWQTFTLGIISSAPYISLTGNVTMRNYHVSSGSTSHRTWIDYIALEKSTTGGQGPRGATGATGSTGATGPAWTGGVVGNVTYYSANLVANSGTSSSSTTSGALVVVGGAGISGNTYIGGNLFVGSANIVGSISSLTANTLAYQSWANATFGTSTYSNSNVASYLTANPQPGTYSNTNVAAYLPTDSTITGIQSSITNKTVTQLVNTGFYANLSGTTGVLETTSIQTNGQILSQGPVVLTYAGPTNTLFQISAVDPNNLALLGTVNTYFDTTLLNLNSQTGNATVTGNVRAAGYTYANGVSIITPVNNNIAGANAAIQTLSANIGSFYTYANATYASTLDGLTDVTISSPAGGQIIKYDNTTSQWINGVVSGSGPYQQAIRTVTNSTSITSADEILLCSGTGAFTVTLPVASTVIGRSFQIKNINKTITTVVGSNSELIDGYTNMVMAYENSLMGITSTGSGWIVF